MCLAFVISFLHTHTLLEENFQLFSEIWHASWLITPKMCPSPELVSYLSQHRKIPRHTHATERIISTCFLITFIELVNQQVEVHCLSHWQPQYPQTVLLSPIPCCTFPPCCPFQLGSKPSHYSSCSPPPPVLVWSLVLIYTWCICLMHHKDISYLSHPIYKDAAS